MSLSDKITPEQLHKWYLQAIKYVDPENFNPKADKDFEDMTEEQQYIDQHITLRINEVIKQAVKELKEEIDKIDLDPACSIQDYLIEAQDKINKKFGEKLI